jgi:hypothetical protein
MLWCLRASKIDMRRQAAKAAALLLALMCGSLQAKPTRTLTRFPAHKFVLTQPARRATRDRALASPRATSIHQRTADRTEIRGARRSGRAFSASKVDLQPPIHAQSDRKHLSRSRTLVEERAAAAQAAIDAADYSTRLQGHHFTSQRSRLRFERASVVVSPQYREPVRRESAITDETETDAPAANVPTTLTNVDGLLTPTSGSLAVAPVPQSIAPLFLPALKLSSLYDAQGRLILPRPLYGSHEILLHQNQMADRDGLDRIQDDADLLDLRRQKKLVALPESEALRIDYRLPEDRRYSRPWTAAFLSLIAADFYATFHTPLQVDSAVRTIAVQQHLLRTNGNAASTTGEAASPHLTGQAVDIAKGGLNLAEIAWMRTYLQPLIDVGKIDVEEEFQQSCFHISVYKSFLPGTPARMSVATARQSLPNSRTEEPSY